MKQPFNKWPLWAKIAAKASNEQDKGLGDTIARVVGPFGGDKYKVWHKAIFGIDCGCELRQEALNSTYSYEP